MILGVHMGVHTYHRQAVRGRGGAGGEGEVKGEKGLRV